jgi:hypothetical protein
VTTIRSNCVDCGEVDLSVDEILLELTVGAIEGIYRFDCPGCGASYRRPAGQQVVEALLAMGAEYRIVPTSSPITQQEIAEFVASLDTDTWSWEIIPPAEGDPRD